MSKDYKVGHGKPPKDKRWQKGQSGNPKGRRKLPPELLAARKDMGEFLNNGVSEIMVKFYTMNMMQFKEWADKKSGTMLENHLAKSLIKAVERGDIGMLNWLMERYIGKPKQAVSLSGQINTEAEFTRDQLKAIAREYVRREGNDD